jgi:type VI secretion system secreted protein Hcp
MAIGKTNIYLKLEGIDGESSDENHQGWIELQTFSWSVVAEATFEVGQGGQAKQSHIKEILGTKACDKATVILWKNCTTGRHIPKGTISCMKLDGETRIEYLKIELKDLMVKEIEWKGVSEDIITEDFKLVFAEFKQTYTLQHDLGGAGGGREFGYNIQTARAS